MIDYSTNLSILLNEDDVKFYLNGIEDVKEMSISDVEEMVAYEASVDTGDILVDEYKIMRNDGSIIEFGKWFDEYCKTR